MCVGIYCVCSCMGCLSQNVCTAASAAAGAGRVVPEKLRMKNKRKEVTKTLPWHWAI